MSEKQQTHISATTQEIRSILGSADEETVFSIQETGASGQEVLQALTWLNDDDYIGAELKRTMNNRIRAVYEILQEVEDETENRRSRH